MGKLLMKKEKTTSLALYALQVSAERTTWWNMTATSWVRTFARVRPLTLLSQHVKQATLTPSLKWLPALVTLTTNQLEDNAWISARRLSPGVWLWTCHWASGQHLGSTFARNPIAAFHCQHLWRNLKRPNPLLRDKGIMLVSLPSATGSLSPLVSLWPRILLLWTSQRGTPATRIQLCLLPHLISDPRIRTQMFSRTPLTPLFLPLPSSTPRTHPLPKTAAV